MNLNELLLLIQFLTNAAVALYRNDRQRVAEIENLTLSEIVDLAKKEAADAEQAASDLLNRQS